MINEKRGQMAPFHFVRSIAANGRCYYRFIASKNFAFVFVS